MNFPLRTAFKVSHRFWVVVFSFSFVSMQILISFLISAVICWLFSSVLFSLPEGRLESFTGTTQERGQVHEAELAVDGEGRILGVKDRFIHDTGAYDPYGLTIPINTQCTLLGPYRVPSYESEFTVAFTNKTLVTPVRGAGRQHGVFVIERLLDRKSTRLNSS